VLIKCHKVSNVIEILVKQGVSAWRAPQHTRLPKNGCLCVMEELFTFDEYRLLLQLAKSNYRFVTYDAANDLSGEYTAF